MSVVNLQTNIPHSARIYDYLLGGKDNFQADRAAADEAVQASPTLPASMRANRRFMVRVARHLAADLGLRQFLDVGTGLPTSPNMHEVVQGVTPESRVVYVDNDPIVLVHARALLNSTPEGRTVYVNADLREPRAIFAVPEFAVLDLDQPVAVTLIAIVQLILDDSEVHRIIDELLAPLAPGSALAISTVTVDGSPEDVGRAVTSFKARGINVRARTRTEFAALFHGLEVVEPGIVPIHRWHPDEEDRTVPDSHVHMFGGVGIKR